MNLTNPNSRRFLIILMFLFWAYLSTSYAQKAINYPEGDVYANSVFDENIRSVEIFKEGWDLTFPVIQLGTDDRIILRFDDLNTSNRTKNYTYTIVHCEADWRSSDLFPQDYLDGFEENRIEDYRHSFNTKQAFINYSINIPNRYVNILMPGNYAVIVTEDYNKDKPVLIRRFMVADKKIDVDVNVRRATLPQLAYTHQEVDFTINTGGYRIIDPLNELKVVVLQNNHWDNAITGLKPKFINGNSLVYDFENENVFPAGNEFRHFDTKDIRFKEQRTQNIYFDNDRYHFQLIADQIRALSAYLYQQDINGRRRIELENSEQSEIDADYVYVHFRLPVEAPMVGVKLYVYGELSDWSTTDAGANRNLMDYNFNQKCYEAVMLCKQGYYNYQYAAFNQNTKILDTSYIEGNHYETENEYLILVYHRPFDGRSDKLIGVKSINSLKKL